MNPERTRFSVMSKVATRRINTVTGVGITTPDSVDLDRSVVKTPKIKDLTTRVSKVVQIFLQIGDNSTRSINLVLAISQTEAEAKVAIDPKSQMVPQIQIQIGPINHHHLYNFLRPAISSRPHHLITKLLMIPGRFPDTEDIHQWCKIDPDLHKILEIPGSKCRRVMSK